MILGASVMEYRLATSLSFILRDRRAREGGEGALGREGPDGWEGPREGSRGQGGGGTWKGVGHVRGSEWG
jgi:hypothetical protein